MNNQRCDDDAHGCAISYFGFSHWAHLTSIEMLPGFQRGGELSTSLLASSLATAELPQHVPVVQRVSHARRFGPHLCLVSVLELGPNFGPSPKNSDGAGQLTVKIGH